MKLKSLFIIATLGVFVSGCKKDWLAVNKDPNNLTGSISPSFVMASALGNTANNEVLQNELGSFWAGQWTQSSSYILDPARFSNQFANTDFNYWDAIYDNLEDYQYVINNAEAQKQPALKGAALTMKAYLFQRLVDLYGNVPFTQALQAPAVLFPKFDNQKDIYEALIPMLDTAIANLKANPFQSAYVGGDVTTAGSLGQGSNTKWIKFANSLKLRILIRQDRIAGRDAYIIPQLQKVMQESNGFLGTGQDFGINPGYTTAAGQQNPFYDRYGYSYAGATQSFGRFPRPTKYLFDVLINSNDTFRLKRIAYAYGGENTANPGVSKNPEIVTNYVGVPYGVGSGYLAGNTSYIGPSVLTKGKNNLPVYLMTASEVQFLLAEAAYKYGSSVTFPNTAQQYYAQGVIESFRLLGVPNATAQANALLTSGIANADWTASPDKLTAIWTQKWIALVNYEGMEAWTEYRRTGVPNIPLSASVTAGSPRPLRMYYPATELGSNQANVVAQGTVDPYTTKIFWMP